MKKLTILAICIFCLFVSHQGFSFQHSIDPNSLTPIRGTIWQFDYIINNYSYSKIVGFGNDILKNEQGEVSLISTDTSRDGLVLYGQFPGFENETGFICTLMGSQPINEFRFYMFHVDGNSATGHFASYNSLTPNIVQTSNLIGIKIADLPGDQNQPDIPTDSNQPDTADLPVQPVAEEEKDKSSDSDSFGCFISSLMPRSRI